MQHTSDNFGKQIACYPRHVSDRADQLIEELDEAQVMQLFRALQTMTYTEWMSWLLDARAKIRGYDLLRASERKRRIRGSKDAETLMLQHACVVLELLRAETSRALRHMPPAGSSLDAHYEQREMFLVAEQAWRSTGTDLRTLWPFEHPDLDGETWAVPFAE